MSGEVPSGWSKRTLGDVARPKQWPTIPQTSFTADGYPVYGANGRIGYFARYTHAEETVAITCRGATCGNVHLTPPFVYITGNAMALDALDQELVGPRYLAFVLRHQGVAECVTGSAQPQIIGSELRRVNLTLPPLPEQRRIAEILDTLDEAIRKTEQVIAKLQQVKQGLLHDLLTRGIDENGELRDPLRNPEQFKDSPLGRIPKGWEVETVGRIAAVSYGVSDAIDQTRTTGVPTVTLPCVDSEGELTVGEELLAYTAPAKAPESMCLVPGDLLFNWRNGSRHHLGKLAYFDAEGRFTHVGFLLRVRSHRDLCDPRYLCARLRYMKTAGFFLAAKSQVNNTFNAGELRAVSLPVPSLAEQGRIAASLSWPELAIVKEVTRVSKLRLLKQGLMDDLLTGRVRVNVTEATE